MLNPRKIQQLKLFALTNTSHLYNAGTTGDTGRNGNLLEDFNTPISENSQVDRKPKCLRIVLSNIVGTSHTWPVCP